MDQDKKIKEKQRWGLGDNKIWVLFYALGQVILEGIIYDQTTPPVQYI